MFGKSKSLYNKRGGIIKITLIIAAVLILGIALIGVLKNRSPNTETKDTGQNDSVVVGNKDTNNFTLGPGKHEFSLNYDGLKRVYNLYIPGSYDPRKSTPLVFYIHGGGGNNEAGYVDGIDDYSEDHGFILAIPEGTGEVKFGNIRAYWNGGEWATGECCGEVDDVGYIEKVIDDIEDKVNINSDKVYAMGISNGGLMTNRLACELADKITAIATIAPAAIPSDCNPSRPVPILDIHGTEDPINPYDGSLPTGVGADVDYVRMSHDEVISAWLGINGCSNKSEPSYQNGGASCVVYNDCRGDSEVEFCEVDGMGHTWPSGSNLLKAVVGPVSKDISTDQIWEFFGKYSL